MTPIIKTIVSRLQEASTWAGLSGLFLANAVIMGDEYQKLLGACGLIAGAVAVLLREHGHAD